MKLTPLDPWIKNKINASDLPSWQLSKLNETIALSRARSSFYRQLFKGLPDKLNSLEELKQFPFTSAENVRENALRIVCVSQDEIQRVVTLQSSGTTGEPKRIYFTADDQELTIDFFGIGMTSLTEPGDRVLILLPGEKPGSVGDLLRLGLARQDRIPLPYGPVRDPLHTLATMEDQKADCLVGTPTQILGLAKRWNPKNKSPRTVLLSTDYVPAAIVQELEVTWGCEVFNHYGTTEMGLGGGVECAAHRGYHMREADLYIEVVDPLTGEPVPDGSYGEVVFSTLTRRGMPLIRYKMGDRSRFIPGCCPCGTSLRTLEFASGRYSGFIPAGGTLLKLPDLDEALFAIPGLLNFSVVLDGEPGNESISIHAHRLGTTDARPLIEEALRGIAATQHFRINIHCQQNPNEPGSILKRTIIDKRGQHA